MNSKTKKTPLQNTKYLNTLKVCIDSLQYCVNNWFYFVGCTWALVFQVFSLRVFYTLGVLVVCFGLPLLIHLIHHRTFSFFFLLKFLPSLTDISFQILRFIFVMGFFFLHCENLYTVVCSCHVVTGPLIDIPQFCGRCEFSSAFCLFLL